VPRAPGRLARWWHDVAEAAWDPDDGRIVLRWVDGALGTTIALDGPTTRLAQVVRERVTSTYVISQRVPVRGSRGVCVAIRRDVRDGTSFRQTVPDDGLGPLRPEVTAQVDALARDLAEQAGLRPPGGGPRAGDEEVCRPC
jgi:hypothetical protein